MWLMLCSEPPKVAVTELAAVTVTAQAASPVQAPVQLAKVLPVAGVSISITAVLGAKFAVQVPVEGVAQLIPAGLLVTVPEPPPAVATVKGMPPLKSAPTVAAAVRVRLHVPLPEQLPVQPLKEKLAAGASVKVTSVFGGKLAVHVVVVVGEQLIPAGLLVTVPPPTKATVSGTAALKVALTLAAALRVKLQVPVPVQLPPHPPNKKLVPGVAVSVICVPCAKLALHAALGQLIPAGVLVIVPLPAAGAVTVS